MTKRTIAFTAQLPYISFGYPPAKCPGVFIRLSVGDRMTTPLLAMVDSGADRAQFPTLVATRLLGLSLDDLDQVTSFTAGGPAIIYGATVTMHFERTSFPADVRFNPHLDPSVAILGRDDIFSHFLIGFDHRNRTLLYTRYKPAPRALRS